MRNAWKRTVALALAVGMLLSLSVFGVSASGSSSDKVVYDFYQPEYIDADCNPTKSLNYVRLYHQHSDETMHSVLGDIYDRYGDDLNWRYEAASALYQFRPTGNNLMGHEYAGLQYCTTANGWFAVRIQSPGSGVYSVSLKHGTHENGALEGNIYILDAAGIDAAVAAATVEGVTNIPEAQSDDPYQNNSATTNTVYTDYISANLTDVIATSNWCSEEAGVVGSAVSTAGVYNFEAGKEYVLVLKATKDTNVPKKDGTDNTNAYLYFGEFIAEKVTDLPVDAVNESYGMYLSAYENQKVGPLAATIKTAYEAENSTQNWRLETTTSTYQFTSTRSNQFQKNSATMRLLHGVSTASTASFVAFRVKSPGTGNFKISLKYRALYDGADNVTMYVLPASAMEAKISTEYTYSSLAADIANNFSVQGAESSVAAFGTVNTAIRTLLKDTSTTSAISNISFYAAQASVTDVQSKEGATQAFEEDKDYIVVFKVESDGKGDADLSDTQKANTYLYLTAINFEQVVETSNVASNGTTSYATIAEALEKTTSGTVTVTANSVEEDLVIPTDVTLDLNGKTVYADAVTTADATGNAVIDTGATKGKLITSSVAFDEANSGYVPVADGNTYVFYEATVKRYNPYFANGDTSAAKFYFDVELDDAAYAVLAEDISQLSVSVGLSWVAGGVQDSIEPVGYAESVNQAWVDGEVGGGNYAWYLNVTGLSVLTEGDTVTVAPAVTVNGVVVTVAPVTYTVQ